MDAPTQAQALTAASEVVGYLAPLALTLIGLMVASAIAFFVVDWVQGLGQMEQADMPGAQRKTSASAVIGTAVRNTRAWAGRNDTGKHVKRRADGTAEFAPLAEQLAYGRGKHAKR